MTMFYIPAAKSGPVTGDWREASRPAPRTGAHLPRRHDRRQGRASPAAGVARSLNPPIPPTKAKRETSREAAGRRRRGRQEMFLDVTSRRAEKAGPRAPHTVRLA